MAIITKIITPEGSTMKGIFVNSSVGKNAVNSGTDVMLLKALLHYICLDASLGLPFRRNEVPLPYDGAVYGIASLIKKFQNWVSTNSLKKVNHKLIADGRISPLPGTFYSDDKTYQSIRGNVFYTIAA